MPNCIRKCSCARTRSPSWSRPCGRLSVGASSWASRTTWLVFSFTLGLWTSTHSRAQLVSQSLRFISTTIHSGAYRHRGDARHDQRAHRRSSSTEPRATHARRRGIRGYPLEYVRAELHVSEVATPRQAAADVVKALGGVGPDSESPTTGVPLEWIGWALTEASAGCGGEEEQGHDGVPLRGWSARSGTLTARLSLRFCVLTACM